MSRYQLKFFLIYFSLVAIPSYFAMRYFGNEYVFDFLNSKSARLITMNTVDNLNLISIISTYFIMMLRIQFRGSLISRAPGYLFLNIIDFIYSKKVQERVFRPLLADMMDEYFQALDEGKIWKSRWIRIKTFINLMIAVFSQMPVSMVKLFIQFWKIT